MSQEGDDLHDVGFFYYQFPFHKATSCYHIIVI